MADKAWKQFERDVAQYFGGMRKEGSGSMGRGDHIKADIYHPALFVECKARKVYAPLVETVKLLRDEASKNGRVPILILGNGMVAVHSSNLLHVAAVLETSSPMKAVRLLEAGVNRRLRSSFDDYDEAVEMASEHSQIPLLAIRQPRKVGFVLLFHQDNLKEVAGWRAVGGQFVERVGGKGLTEAEKDLDGTLRTTIHEVWWHQKEGVLSSFDHCWQLPKKRKKT